MSNHCRIAIFLAVLAFLPPLLAAEKPPVFTVVEDGAPAAVIVADVPEKANEAVREGVGRACEMMRFAVERATGAKLEIIPATGAIPEGKRAILIGGGRRAKAAAVEMRPLPVEGYGVIVQPERCVLYGDLAAFETEDPRPKYPEYPAPWAATPFFAVAEIVQSRWHGRWLWPGPDGFAIPAQKNLSLAVGDETFRPKLRIRWFSGPRVAPDGTGIRDKKRYIVAPDQTEAWDHSMRELADWYYFHRFGSRLLRGSQHSFHHWWEKYHAAEPDLFAQPPPGFQQPWSRPDRVKLRDGNPKVWERILEEWRAAGRPAQWGIGPNDGNGFCTAPESMALDEPPNQDPETVWRGDGNLSARYSRLWSRILEQVREENPQAEWTTLIYGCYNSPPAQGVDLHNLLGAFVHGWTPAARTSWSAWRNAGARLYLRPNWFHIGSAAPYIQPHAMGSFIRWTIENGSLGFYFDGLEGQWANQGLTYYLIARLGEDPKLTVDAITDEYTSAFGAAKPLIAEYLRYWEDHATALAYPIPVGGSLSVSSESRYEQLVREKGIPKHPLGGSHHALPYFYGADVVEPAQALLQRAAEAVGDDRPEVRRRVRFLQLGLEHLILTRDAVALAFKVRDNPSAENREAFLQKRKELRAFRKKVTPLNVVSEVISNNEERRRNSPATGARILPERLEDGGI
ncbi:MAG TPA: DUF4838 domain-containing protein [Chthoniobacteraceae bacterium]|nr:DUF4838 domain-containing protein [Chthoniobacteraceae bacterium]